MTGAPVVESVDALDSKSSFLVKCQFESGQGHQPCLRYRASRYLSASSVRYRASRYLSASSVRYRASRYLSAGLRTRAMRCLSAGLRRDGASRLSIVLCARDRGGQPVTV